jgi:sugar phosphate isomerase/epimerase
MEPPMRFIFGFNVVEKPVEEYFDYAAAHGLEHLEIDLMVEHSVIETFRAKRIARLGRLSRQFGISLSVHTPYTINPADGVPMLRAANVAYLRRCVEVGHRLGVRHMTTHIGSINGVSGWETLRRKGLERLAMSLAEILPLCERYGVRLALENCNLMPEHSEFYYLGDNIRDLEFLFSKLRSRWLNLCLDVGHAHTNEGVTRYIRRFAGKIIAVHYHDNNGRYDEHLGVGKGTIGWGRVARAFKEIGFRGPFISETGGMAPHEARDKLLTYF